MGSLALPRHLSLNGNQLTALPPEIGNLTKRSDGKECSYQLSALPQEKGKLISTGYLSLSGYPRSTLPPERV